MSVLDTAVRTALPAAIHRAQIQTAILAESNQWVQKDTRNADVVAFERDLRNSGAMGKALEVLASKIMGAPITLRGVTVSQIKPIFLGVVVATKPHDWEAEDYHGVPFNTGVLLASTGKLNRSGQPRLRWADKTSYKQITLTNDVFAPASDEVVKTTVEALFKARPALTLKLFDVPIDGAVAGEDSGEEE